jgi:hypothetical protein
LTRFSPAVSRERITEAFGAFGTSPREQALRSKIKRGADTILERVLKEKKEGTRRLPSSTLISNGDLPAIEDRKFLIDACARLVDENWSGRSDMCIYFAALLRHGLGLLGYQSVVQVGKAKYSMDGETYEWDHSWVRTECNDIIDGNIDSIVESPFVPDAIKPQPYWGQIDGLPADRIFQRLKDLPPERDNIELNAHEISRWKADLEREVKTYKESR